MQRIYEPENLMEGELLQGMLASEGIEAHLVGRDLVGGSGELPIFGLLGLSVDNDQADYARELITAYNTALPLSGDEAGSFPARWSVRLVFVLSRVVLPHVWTLCPVSLEPRLCGPAWFSRRSTGPVEYFSQ